MDDDAYLQPGFDPKTLKVAQLRSVLLEHDVPYSSSAKKAVLVGLFLQHISPKAAEIRAQRNAVNPSSNGIVDVHRSSSSEPELEPESKRATESRRKTSKSKNEVISQLKDEKETSFSNNNVFQRSPRPKSPLSSETETPPAIVPRKRRAAQKADEDAVEDTVKPTRKKTTRASSLKKKSALDLEKLEDEDEIDFLPKELKKENIGNATIQHSNDKKPAKVAKTNKVTKPKKEVKPLKRTRRTKEDFEEDIKPDEPVNQSKTSTEWLTTKSEPESPPLVTVNESTASPVANINMSHLSPEFASALSRTPKKISPPTVSELNSLQGTPLMSTPPKKRWQDGDVLALPSISDDEETLAKLKEEMAEMYDKIEKETSETLEALEHSSNFSIGTFLKYISLWILCVWFFVGVWWYRDQAVQVGYCGVEVYVPTITYHSSLRPDLAHYADLLEDQLYKLRPVCDPCPEHSVCFPMSQIKCEEDYMVYRPWYSLGGLIPKTEFCILDTRKADKITKMTQYCLDLLRRRNAELNCGEGKDADAGLTTGELHDLLYAMKSESIGDEEFEVYWSRALQDLATEEDIHLSHIPGNGEKPPSDSDNQQKSPEEDTLIRSTSTAKLNFRCRVERALFRTLLRHKVELLFFVLLSSAVQYLRIAWRRRSVLSTRVDVLTKNVLTTLHNQRKRSRTDKAAKPYIGSVQLRDYLLYSDDSYTKNKLWSAVTNKVERNTNIKASTLEEHGEILKVWEWSTDIGLE